MEKLKVVTSETDSLRDFTWWTGGQRGHGGEKPLKWEERGREVSDLDPVQADDVSDLEDDGMALQVLGEDGAPDNLVGMVCDLQAGAVV